MTNRPLVSVVVPTFNRADLIGETILSVINQSYPHWELIIVDDGRSTDITESIVESFTDTRIQYYKVNHCAIFGKRKEGIKQANGELIAFLDSDDLWLPEKLECQVELLTQYSQSSFVINNVTLFGEVSTTSPPDYDSIFVGNMLLPILSETKFISYPSTLLFRKDVMKKIGPLNEGLVYGTDTWFFLKLCQNFTGIFTNKRLVKIRKHHTNSSGSFDIRVFLDSINTVTDIYKDGSISTRTYRQVVGHYYYKMGLCLLPVEPHQARTSFKKYIKLKPLAWNGYIRYFQAFILTLKK